MFGLKSFIIGGVRSKKQAGKANIFHPGNIVTLTAYPSKGDSLSRIKEISYAHHFSRINQEVIVSMVSSFIMEVCQKSIQEKEQNKLLFDFLKSRLIVLDQKETTLKAFHLKFLIELSSYLGFAPYDNYDENNRNFDLSEGRFINEDKSDQTLCDINTSFHLHTMMQSDLSDMNQMIIDKASRDLVLDKLLLYYKYHLESLGPIKSLEVLRTVLS